MRRPVLDSTRGEADYGYSELGLLHSSWRLQCSTPGLTNSFLTLLQMFSAGYQDPAGYELIGPGSTSCGRNNADDAKSAATTPVPEEEFFRQQIGHHPHRHLLRTTVSCENDKPTGPGAQIYANSKFADTVLQSRQEKGGGGEGGGEGRGGGEACTGNFTLQQPSHPTCGQFDQLLSQLPHQVWLHQVHMMPGRHSAGTRTRNTWKWDHRFPRLNLQSSHKTGTTLL